MFPHDPYAAKMIEYLACVGFLVLFVGFWRYVNGEAPARAVARVRAWSGQLSEWFRIPDGVFVHPGHAWVREEAPGLVAVGIDDFAQTLVGPLRGVRLPKTGSDITAGERAWALAADSKAVDMLAPVTGTVVAVNRRAIEKPELVNDDPYGDGWLLRVRVPERSSQVALLKTGSAARRWIADVADQFMSTASPELGHVLQDGGMPIHGLARGLDEEHWDQIARKFLLTAVLLVAAVVFAPSAASAQGSMPKLVPDDFRIARSADSPGQVLFNHSTHVDSDKPDCLTCHPTEFRILKADAGRKKILHANMEKGRQCGACHDGKKAFAIEADCANCHR